MHFLEFHFWREKNHDIYHIYDVFFRCPPSCDRDMIEKYTRERIWFMKEIEVDIDFDAKKARDLDYLNVHRKASQTSLSVYEYKN